MALSEDTATAADVTTDAQFRALCTSIRARVTGAGLTQTGDTGQINLTTVTAPATNTYAGYDIFVFTDTEQSTDPIYLKLEYGKGGATSRLQLRMTVGTGSDGAGNIVNPSTARAITPNANSSGNAYVGGSFFNGMFVLIVSINASGSTPIGTQLFFAVERGRDLDGALLTGEIAFGFFGNTMSAEYRLDGYWLSTASPDTAGPSDVVSGVSIFDTIKLTNSNTRPFWFRSVLLGPSSLASNDSGSVEIDGVSRTFKRPAFASRHTNTAANGYAVIRSA